MQLEAAEVIRGVFVSDDRELVDAENVLFYNLDARSFADAPQCVRFERSWQAAPPCPTALAAPARYHHIYEGVSVSDGFGSWEAVAVPVASWTDVPCSRVAGDRAGWHVWKAMRRAIDSIEPGSDRLGPADDFAVSLSVRMPAGQRVKAMSAVKGVVDGVIASFQAFGTGTDRAREVAELLAAALPDSSSAELLDLLTDSGHQLFAAPPFNAKGRLALNPCDDQCVAGELVVRADSSLNTPRLSGRLTRVRAAARRER
jgi:hypothetical protein